MTQKKQKDEVICFCNNIPRKVIEDAIRKGAKTLNEIYDATTAGIGPCGGSCRRKIAPMLENILKELGPAEIKTAEEKKLK